MSMQEFGFPPPGKFAQMFTVFIGLVLPVLVAATIIASSNDTRAWLAVLPALVVMPIAAAALVWSMYRRRVRLDAGVLRFGMARWSRVAVAALDLDAARIVNLDQQRELRPAIRLAGTAMPGYRSGWYWLRNRKRAYVVLMDWRRVLLLSRRDGVLILLGVERPEALLDALRQAADDKADSAR